MRIALHGGLQSHSFFKNCKRIQLILGFPGKNWNVFICFFIVFYHKSNFLDINEKKMIHQWGIAFHGSCKWGRRWTPWRGAPGQVQSGVFFLVQRMDFVLQLCAARPPWVSTLKCFLKVHLKLSVLREVWLPAVKCIVSGKVLFDLIESESLCSLSNAVGQRWEGGPEF